MLEARSTDHGGTVTLVDLDTGRVLGHASTLFGMETAHEALRALVRLVRAEGQ